MESSEESNDSSSRSATTDVQLTSTQAEPLALLQKFIDLITSDPMSNAQDLLEFRTMIRQLCEKAPGVAQTFVATIQEFSNSDVSQQEPTRLDNGANHSMKRKGASGKDLSYRPTSSAKGKAGKPKDKNEIDINYLAQDPISDGIQSSVLNENDIAAQGDGVELSVEMSRDGIDVSQEVSPRLDQRERLVQDGRDPSEIAVGNNKEGSIRAAKAASASNEAEQPNVSSEPMLHIMASPSTPTDMAPVTPMKQMEGALASPLTEEIHRGKIPTSLKSVSSSPKSKTGSSSTEATSLMDMILEAARTIHQFNKYPHGAPKGAHARIIQTFRKGYQEVIGASNFNKWSDGSMWIQVLEMGSSARQKVTILNMLEYMGAGAENGTEHD